MVKPVLAFPLAIRCTDGDVKILFAHFTWNRPTGDVSNLPTLKGESVVLDVGANIGATAGQLVEYAVMGSAMVRALSENSKPTVGLLNIGVEELKGLEDVRIAGQMLRDAQLDSMHYHGFVEGNDIGAGTVDVVVTEGFSGNIALKTAEGTAKQITRQLSLAMRRTLMARIGSVFASGAFDFLRNKLDPRNSNGAVLLGLNGVVIKSHGGTDKEGFAAAVEMGHDMAANGLLEKITRIWNILVHEKNKNKS